MDRAALDVALERGLPTGGWCPKGRLAEDGKIPMIYRLKETPSPHYAQRTRWNVRDADGTLVLTYNEPTGGTALTIHTSQSMHKPYYVIDLTAPEDPRNVASWISHTNIAILNVAGPRESICPGIYQKAFNWLQKMLESQAE